MLYFAGTVVVWKPFVQCESHERGKMVLLNCETGEILVKL